MPEIDREKMGATMRLGLRPTIFTQDSEWSTIRKLYHGATQVLERHRHRYEVNPDFIKRVEEGGLRFIGRDEGGERMEIFELPDHPYYVGTQFHPEYLTRPLSPSPPYLGFVAASAKVLDGFLDKEGIANRVNGIKV